ncbi:conserved Plasmodium protein, unknown function [Plasmodium berghei]|uniref:Uncharacterized protein n=2 Tax=Plasmodium berghei TaxID=5821 RepID=A0A509AI79_PLABA|nr:conserved Plasmodium protein, unknown function [Plasmodium berghei ANKA]CXI29494.1 conserved Plasmodium protein, unknown function [Plasmodium berghei]SCM20722.1 conserved Plasmodium protein, unknown function [Plasmodium berghei]SCN24280.1 conserved Plasmodium protein, unknown function [Plasmodium berghei]SCO59472.1 conserved Plasmodium protein, unknown function [Plasmodium berghei]SCO60710.1 conserved Plasmodium protein, unknown function [Plasmodium berghei]|eukprot:XP_034421012.1 conserved Plasmodium protein, unknown function [Plasmodium berghei ANKA]
MGMNSAKVKENILITQKIIEKISKIKKENVFYNCIPYYDFIYNKYRTYLSIESCFKLFYLQNKYLFIHKNLIYYICSKANNTSIYSIFKIKNEFIIDHIYNCNIYKYKYNFQTGYYNFVHNILLISSIRLCRPINLDSDYNIANEKKKREENKNIKLYNFHKYYNSINYIISFNHNNSNNSRDNHNEKLQKLKYLIKLYKCFSTNSIRPFNFLNKYLYSLFSSTHLKISTKSLCMHNTIIHRSTNLSPTNEIIRKRNGRKYQYSNKSNKNDHISDDIDREYNICEPILNIQNISKLLFYLSKCDAYYYYDILFNQYYYNIFIYLLSLQKEKYSITYTSDINMNNIISKKDEEHIYDNLIMSFIIFLSSSYFVKNIKRKISSIVKMIYISSMLLKLICSCGYYKYFKYTKNITESSYKKNIINVSNNNCDQNNFILINFENLNYLFNVSYFKKILLLTYIINNIIPDFVKNIKYSEAGIQRNLLQYLYKQLSGKNISNKSADFVNTNEFDIFEEKNLNISNISNNIEKNIDKNMNTLMANLLIKNTFNILDCIPLHVLILIYHQLFIYTKHNKSHKIFNNKKSLLEKQILFIVQDTLKKHTHNYMCLLDATNYHTFFSIDGIIVNKELKKD